MTPAIVHIAAWKRQHGSWLIRGALRAHAEPATSGRAAATLGRVPRAVRGLDVSVVIAQDDGGGRMLSQCLAHLEVQSYPAGRFEVLVCCPEEGDARKRIDRLLRGCPVPARTVPHAGALWAHALNAGAEAAQGRWLLFLDGDLLAGPGLVECMVRIQEMHGGRGAIIGDISLHPHVDPATFTQWEVLCEPAAHSPGDERPWHGWRAFTLCLPRDSVAAAGGFQAIEDIDPVTDLELAYRLSEQGMTGYYAQDAMAYSLRPTTLDHERRRHYLMGYATHALLKRVAMPQLRDSILGQAPKGAAARARLELPVWEQLVNTMDPGSSRYRPLMRRILHLRAHQGYADARAGRPRRTFSRPAPLPTPDDTPSPRDTAQADAQSDA